MNTQLMIFLVRRWWWMWLLCAVTSASTGVLGALSLLLFTVASPCLVLMLAAEKEGLQRALSFMTLRRSEVQRSLWMVLVLLPGVLLFVGVLGGSGLATVLEWKWRDDLSALHFAVAVGHAEILLVGVYVLAQTTRSKIGTQGLQAASGLLPMVMIVSGQYLDRSERETVLAYLDHPAALLVALSVVPLGLWTWKVAPELGWGSVSRGNAGRAKITNGDQPRAGAAKGLRGFKLLFGMEVIPYVGIIVVLPVVILGITGVDYLRTGNFEGIQSFPFIWIVFLLVLLFVIQDMKALRLLGVSGRKLAGLMLVAPVMCAVILTVGLAWVSPSLREGWGVVALFGVLLGSTCCLRLISLHLPTFGVILLVAPGFGLLSTLDLTMAPMSVLIHGVLAYGGPLGVLLAVGCWWVLVRSFSRGRYVYALNQKQMAKMQPQKGG
jgi:hypothetical protein